VATEPFSRRAPDDNVKRKLDLLVPVLRRALTQAEARVRHRRQDLAREKLMEHLSRALARVRTLTELLPLCWSEGHLWNKRARWRRL
jgi:hypothetical protein